MNKLQNFQAIEFELPANLEAGEPPEARGLARDDVRLMVSYQNSDAILHTTFRYLDHYLEAGDVLIVNTSGTLNAALPALAPNGDQLELHLSTQLPAGLWSVELRQFTEAGTKPFYSAQAGEQYQLPNGGILTLLTPYNNGQRFGDNKVRLWVATVHLPLPLLDYLNQEGVPIRYGYVQDAWPSDYYQTVYATEMGSAEMPSAGRAFTAELITKLAARGVQIAPLILHTGVASLEDHEPPYEEYFDVPLETAELLNAARDRGARLIAVGTTVVRALETVVDKNGRFHPGTGWTDIIITPHTKVRSVDGMLTGMHEPNATHLAMLEAVSNRAHLQKTYQQALDLNYLWHEFGDLHLILPA
ncbi:MAG: S-adenosylmethionine:tRNA ribosyltransferase-isomerase [Chloroflexota bacterium]